MANRWILSLLLFALMIVSGLVAAGCVDEHKTDWQDAQAANTVDAYEEYLEEHPHDKNAVQARARIEELHWREALAANTISSYREYLASHPSGHFVKEAEERIASLINEEILDAVSQACGGIPVEQAAAYTGGPGLHPIVLLNASGGRHEWTHDPAVQPRPESVSTTELVACVGEQHGKLIGTCPYGLLGYGLLGQFRVERYQNELEIRLVEARTGRTIKTDTIRGTPPRLCQPTEEFVGGVLFLRGSNVDLAALLDWLGPYVRPSR